MAGVRYKAAASPSDALQTAPPFRERLQSKIVAAVGKQVERDERRWRRGREHLDARGGRVDAHLQSVEIQAAVGSDDDFAVQDDRSGQDFLKRLVSSGK